MSLPDPMASSQVRDAAPLFAALGDETRLQLLLRLSSSGPASIARLSAQARVSRQAIAKHVQVLSAAGLVRTRRRGRERICELEPARLAGAHQCLDLISTLWDDALDRLRSFVEDDSQAHP
ncbi:MAG: helix-turn-helix transcriptional regulator [Candidatus Lambdaproteobacteria bacterium]|nr:helix-turn-helix transcriptional regulator [Candidatus Lambdaproteobacteria bacterium]